jgi:hypothetical protein
MLDGHVESTKEIFSTSLQKDPLGHHHATHHVFPILDVEYLSSLWMLFKRVEPLCDEKLVL